MATRSTFGVVHAASTTDQKDIYSQLCPTDENKKTARQQKIQHFFNNQRMAHQVYVLIDRTMRKVRQNAKDEHKNMLYIYLYISIVYLRSLIIICCKILSASIGVIFSISRDQYKEDNSSPNVSVVKANKGD